MVIIHDPHCADYGSSLRPEQPARVIRSAAHLRTAHPDWTWQVPPATVPDEPLLLAHPPAHLSGRMADTLPHTDGTPHWLHTTPTAHRTGCIPHRR